MSKVDGSREFSAFADLLAAADTHDEADPIGVTRRRRRRRLGWIAALLVLLLVSGAVGGYVSLTLGAALPAASVSLDRPGVVMGAPAALVLPSTGAAAVSVTGTGEFAGDEALTGQIIASSGSADPLPIASISKLITALVILDAKPLAPGESGPTITFTKADDDLYDKYYVAGATVQSMKAGSQLSEFDALKVMLIVSASNYAEATATWAFGSPSGFTRAARSWLSANGLSGTTLVEPTGIDPRNVSTTADLVAIGRLAMANPVLMEIVSTPRLDVEGFPAGANNNELLGIDGISGLKTGTLEEAGSCLLFSALVDVEAGGAPVPVVGVVLGADGRAAVGTSVRALIASIRDGFHRTDLVPRGAVLGSYTTAWGDEGSIVAVNPASLRTWSDTPMTTLPPVAREVTTAEAGTDVGSLEYTAGTQSVTVGLELDSAIEDPGALWRLTHPEVLLGW